MVTVSIEEQFEQLVQNCVDVVTPDDLRARLREHRPLVVKLGIDPSGPLLHLGHAVVLRKLRQFQDLGHQAVLVVGDFTGRIGDPTDRPDARKPRTAEQIDADMRTYAQQAGLILDLQRARIVHNSTWLSPLTFAEVIRLCGKVTVARMLERDDFRERLAGNLPIGLHELLYPIAQAYDSVALESDVELGGTEQLFNLLMGRRLQEEHDQRPQICLTLPILEGTDGEVRMGKSLDNYIALREVPEQMFGQIMSLPDALLERYWRLTTDLAPAQCDEILLSLASGALSARDAKLQLAAKLVAMYHGTAAGRAAREHFESTVVRKELPKDIAAFSLPPRARMASLSQVLTIIGWAASNREARRQIEQGAIKVDGRRIEDARHSEAWDGKVLQKGNHQFVRLQT